jgi:hypothetical protein
MDLDELNVLKKMIEKNIENVEIKALATFENNDPQNTNIVKPVSNHKSKRVLY